MSHAPPEFHYNVSYTPHALHTPLAAHWRHLLTSSTTSALVARLLTSSSSQYQSACLRQPLLTVDLIGRWPLTLTQSWLFCNLGAPYPVFHVDFIFAYFVSKWKIRTDLLLVAITVADNPTNVFVIFANVLAIVLRLAIFATNQLFQFLLLLLLTLRVANQWLLSLHSLSLLDPLSPFPEMTL